MPDTVFRVDHRPLGLSCPVLSIVRRVLGPAGELLEVVGFESFRLRDPEAPLPTSTALGADLRLEDELHLLLRPLAERDGEPELFFSATFGEPAEEFWSDAAHRARQIAVIVSEQRPNDYESTSAWMLDSLVVLCPLAVYVFAHGVGTRERIG